MISLSPRDYSISISVNNRSEAKLSIDLRTTAFAVAVIATTLALFGTHAYCQWGITSGIVNLCLGLSAATVLFLLGISISRPTKVKNPTKANELPPGILGDKIYPYLDSLKDLTNAGLVCKQWNTSFILEDYSDLIWKSPSRAILDTPYKGSWKERCKILMNVKRGVFETRRISLDDDRRHMRRYTFSNNRFYNVYLMTDKTLKIRNRLSNESVPDIQLTGALHSLDIFESTLAVLDQLGNIYRFNLRNGKLIAKIEYEPSSIDSVKKIALTQEEFIILRDSTAQILDFEGNKKGKIQDDFSNITGATGHVRAFRSRIVNSVLLFTKKNMILAGKDVLKIYSKDELLLHQDDIRIYGPLSIASSDNYIAVIEPVDLTLIGSPKIEKVTIFKECQGKIKKHRTFSIEDMWYKKIEMYGNWLIVPCHRKNRLGIWNVETGMLFTTIKLKNTGQVSCSEGEEGSVLTIQAKGGHLQYIFSPEQKPKTFSSRLKGLFM